MQLHNNWVTPWDFLQGLGVLRLSRASGGGVVLIAQNEYCRMVVVVKKKGEEISSFLDRDRVPPTVLSHRVSAIH